MPLSNAMHRLLVCALAAWMTLCCCEKRILAHAFEASEETGSSCCGGSCCPDDDRGDERDPPARSTCCADGCCTKASFAAPAFAPEVDAVGALLPGATAWDATEEADAGRALAHEDRGVGEPPPRLALLISRRLRI
ncbi:MAG: hypothetical protein RL325_1786 [Planctomycetota bacterium]